MEYPSYKLTYRPEIDGLRAVAVLAVVFYHADLGCPGGYVGVDVFFVISGFLITSLLLRDLRAGKFSLVEFWERRARRILPAISVCVAVTLVAGWFLLLPADLESLGRSALAQSAFVANIYFWRTHNYFGGANLEKPLLHTWSLAVEEQFYFILPVVLMAMFAIPALRRPRALISILVTVFILSLGISIWGVKHQPFAAFFLLPTRAWELLCGSLVAVLPSSRSTSRWLSEGLSWLGLTCIALPIAFYSESTPFPGLAALPPCLGTVALLWANRPGISASGGSQQPTVAASLLSLPPVRFIGLISYSLYLWHWPVLSFANYWKVMEFSTEGRWLLVGASVLLAIVSWRWVETPFRRRRFFSDRKRIFIFAGATTAGLLIVSGWFVVKRGVPMRCSTETLRMVDFLNQDKAQRKAFGKGRNLDDLSVIAKDQVELVGLVEPESTPVFALFGDSHAQVAGSLFNRLARDHGISGAIITYQGTPPLKGWNQRYRLTAKDPQALFDAYFEYVQRNKIRHVFLAAYWSSYQKHVNELKLETYIHKTLEAFAEMGVQVYFMMDNPVYEINVARMVLRDSFLGKSSGNYQPQTYAEHVLKNSAVYAVRDHTRGGLFLDPTEFFWDSKTEGFAIESAGAPLYADNNHLTLFGVETIWAPILIPIFETMAEKSEAID